MTYNRLEFNHSSKNIYLTNVNEKNAPEKILCNAEDLREFFSEHPYTAYSVLEEMFEKETGDKCEEGVKVKYTAQDVSDYFKNNPKPTKDSTQQEYNEMHSTLVAHSIPWDKVAVRLPDDTDLTVMNDFHWRYDHNDVGIPYTYKVCIQGTDFIVEDNENFSSLNFDGNFYLFHKLNTPYNQDEIDFLMYKFNKLCHND